MSTAGDPAPTAIEPRTPIPYRGIGAGALGAAALCTISLAVLIGGTPQTPVTPLIIALALALGIDVGVQFGIWGMREHRLDQRENATRAADEARYSTWVNTEEQRETWHAQQYQTLYEQHQQTRETLGREFEAAIKTATAGIADQVIAVLGDDFQHAIRNAYAAGFVDCASGAPQPGAMASVTRLEPRS